ncbi:DUF2793 domain-containing protein [Asticcacaulis sp. EMRT-3]|uniref:DUF2793 domain-containing protein n=1 Tax=Asticcacaulis sp. EMRT-3 TaxID=3040349 RepID=UPI0024AF6B5C|nr:DUF2793 domain-containing protein [Asticcacaulis sp. EMRT-3]MDI7774985.1 DUF2793 domain-containing protein [Asticcacaulis sp. EMRT-3]
MSDTTPRLNLPLIGDHAQKQLVMNAALMRLESLVQARVISRSVAAEPVTPADGDSYLLPASPTGAVWSTLAAGTFVRAEGGTWEMVDMPLGTVVLIGDENRLVLRTAVGWDAFEAVIKSLGNLTGLGVGTSPDATNVLAVKGPAVLISAKTAAEDGSGDLSLSLNKETDGDTAQILLQTGYSARAVIGLLGDNTLTAKVSDDGSTYATVFQASSGIFQFSPVGQGGPPTVNIGPHALSTTFTSASPAMSIGQGISGDRYAYFDYQASDSPSGGYSTRMLRTPGPDGSFSVTNTGSGDVGITSGGSIYFGSGGTARSSQQASGFHPVGDNTYTLGQTGARWAAVWAANGTIQTSDARDKIVSAKIAPDLALGLIAAVEPVFFSWKSGGQTQVQTGVDTVKTGRMKMVTEAVEVMQEDWQITDGRAVKVSKTLTINRPVMETFPCHDADGQPLRDGEGQPLTLTRPQMREEIEVRPVMKTVDQPGMRRHAGFLAQDMQKAMQAQGIDFGAWGLEDAADPDSRQWLRPDQLVPVLWAGLRALSERVTALESVQAGATQ